MWCDRVRGNIAVSDFPESWNGRAIDLVDIEWTECRRTLDKASRAGRRVRVLLPPGTRLLHGDVLWEDEKNVLVVNVIPREMIVVRSADQQVMALLALELGNLHWPVQVAEDEVMFPEDGPVLEVLRKLGMSFEREIRRFAPVATMITSLTLSADFAIKNAPAEAVEPAEARESTR